MCTISCSQLISIFTIQGPLCCHSTVLIKCIFLTIDGLLFCFSCSISLNLFTVRLEVEPTGLILIIIEYWSKLVIAGCFIICDIHLQPANGHSTVILATKVIITCLEAIAICIIDALCAIFCYPTVKHLAFFIESILLAVYSLQSYIAVISIG